MNIAFKLWNDWDELCSFKGIKFFLVFSFSFSLSPALYLFIWFKKIMQKIQFCTLLRHKLLTIYLLLQFLLIPYRCYLYSLFCCTLSINFRWPTFQYHSMNKCHQKLLFRDVQFNCILWIKYINCSRLASTLMQKNSNCFFCVHIIHGKLKALCIPLCSIIQHASFALTLIQWN